MDTHSISSKNEIFEYAKKGVAHIIMATPFHK